MPTLQPTPDETPRPEAGLFNEAVTNDTIDFEAVKFMTREEMKLAQLKTITSVEDYEYYLAQPRKGRMVGSDQKRLMKMLFYVMENNGAILQLNLDDDGFAGLSRLVMQGRINSARQFFEEHVKEYFLGQRWRGDRHVDLIINPTSGEAHGHRKSYR